MSSFIRHQEAKIYKLSEINIEKQKHETKKKKRFHDSRTLKKLIAKPIFYVVKHLICFECRREKWKISMDSETHLEVATLIECVGRAEDANLERDEKSFMSHETVLLLLCYHNRVLLSTYMPFVPVIVVK